MGLKEKMFAIICDDNKFCGKKDKANVIICAAGTKEDMIKLMKEIKDCPCEHKLSKCEVIVKYG